MPARYIFLLTFCEKFSSGRFGKMRPPPRHSGEEVDAGACATGALLAERFLGGVSLTSLAVSSVRGCPGVRWPGRPRRSGAPALRCIHGRTRCRVLPPSTWTCPWSFSNSSCMCSTLLGRRRSGGRRCGGGGVLGLRLDRRTHGTTWPFFEPGTAPRTSSNWRARRRCAPRPGSATVTVSSPMWPVIFLPGNTRPGSCAIEIEPGTLCERLLPCDARCELKLWRLIVPAKPLPIEVPCTSTFWPARRRGVTGTLAPGAY